MSATSASVVVEADDVTFDEVIARTSGRALVEFFATWCGSCHRFAPTFHALAEEYAGRVPFMKTNVDQNPDLVRRFGLSSTPTLVLLYDGEEVARLIGSQRAESIRELLESELGGPGRAGDGWVPGDACTLPTAQQPLREAEFHTLFSTSLRAVERPEPTWLRLRLDPDPQVRADTRQLVDRESECCSFFDFQLAAADGDLVVDVRVPTNRVDVLDGLGRQAAAAQSRSDDDS